MYQDQNREKKWLGKLLLSRPGKQKQQKREKNVNGTQRIRRKKCAQIFLFENC